MHRQVCAELEGMLSAVDDFRQFLGPELKAVTGNTSVIEEVSLMVSVSHMGWPWYQRSWTGRGTLASAQTGTQYCCWHFLPVPVRTY